MVSNTPLSSSSKPSNKSTSESEMLLMLSSLGTDDYDPQVSRLMSTQGSGVGGEGKTKWGNVTVL